MAKPKGAAQSKLATSASNHENQMERTTSLLKRLRRSLPSATSDELLQRRPPDEASSALGTQLGLSFGNALLSCASTLPSDASADSNRSSYQRNIESLRKLGCDIVDALSDAARASPSAIFGYCQGIFKAFGNDGDDDDTTTLICALHTLLLWWPSWLGQGNAAIKTALIRGYAGCSYRLATVSHSSSRKAANGTDEAVSNLLADAYSGLASDADRRCLLRECVGSTFGNMRRGHTHNEGSRLAGVAIAYLSELVAVCIILPTGTSTSASTSSSSVPSDDNRALLLTAIIRECRLFISSSPPMKYCSDAMVLIVPWLADIMKLCIRRTPCQQTIGRDEIFSMFLQLCDLLCHISSTEKLTDGGCVALTSTMGEAYNTALGEMLCHFSGSSGYMLAPTIVQLCDAVCCMGTNAGTLSDVTIFRLALLALNTPDEEEAQRILHALHATISKGCFDGSCGDVVLVGTIRAVGCIFSASAVCNAVAGKLQKLANENERNLSKTDNISSSTSFDHIVRLFGGDSILVAAETNLLSNLVAPTSDNQLPSPYEMICDLLLASSLLCTNGTNNDGEDFPFLLCIVARWPHLGVRAIPLATSAIQSSAALGDSNRVASALRFLCSGIAKDPTCAQNVWGVLSQFVEPSSPSVVRVTCLRLYLLLCKSNRKLYGRIRDSLGLFMSSPDAKARVAAVATLCDLAKADLIRDVSEVIGWLQNGLEDEESIVVHYVIMTLHYLVQEGELDFDTVIKVISKKLVKIDDISSVLSQPLIVIEALVALLGDGAAADADGGRDNDSSSGDEEEGEISPQVEAAIIGLVALAEKSEQFSMATGEDKETRGNGRSEVGRRILQSIYSSLSNYNIASLEIGSDMLRSMVQHSGSGLREETSQFVESGERYFALQSVVLDGLLHPRLNGRRTVSENRQLIQLTAKFLAFEENSLGPLLWKKGGSPPSHTKGKKPQKLPKAVLGALPDVDIVESRYHDNPCTATAVARMFCIDAAPSSSSAAAAASSAVSTTGQLMEHLADISCDLKSDSSDPLIKVLSVGSRLESMKAIWSSIIASNDGDFKAEKVTTVMQELIDSKDYGEQHDNALVTLSAFASVLPDRHEGIDLTNIADETYKIILDAYESRSFGDVDAAAISLGFMGSRYARSMILNHVENIVRLLERVDSFDALYSLGRTAQALSCSLSSMNKADLSGNSALMLVGRIISVLISHFHSYMVEPIQSLLSFIACLKTGTSTPDLLACVHLIDEASLNVTENMKLQVKGIFLSLAVALPALRHVDTAFLQAACSLVVKCPWGSGKGFALAAAYNVQSNLISKEEMKRFFSTCVDAAEEAADGALFDDAIYAAVAFDRIMPADEKRSNDVMSLIRRALVRNSDNTFAPDSRATATLAACAHVGYVPLISENFEPHLYLDTKKAKLETIVDMLIEVATDVDESRKCSDMAIIVLGVLCCMKLPRQGVMQMQSSHTDLAKKSKAQSSKANDLPLAQDVTLLRKILDLARTSLADGGDEAASQRAPLLISSISRLPLPGAFSLLAKRVLNEVSDEKGTIKAAFLRLVIAQIECERHSGPNRSEFINLSIYIAKRTPAEFWSLFASTGTAVDQFMTATSSFLLRWPSGVIDEVLENLWTICCFEKANRDSSRSARALLLSLCATLERCNADDQVTKKTSSRGNKSSSLLSPIVLTSIRKLLVVTIFPSLVDDYAQTLKDETEESVWSSYFSCLESIPSSFLNEHDFCVVGKQGEDCITSIARINCIAHLTKRGDYFGSQTAREVLKAQLWIARQQITSLNMHQLTSTRLAMIQLASSHSDLSPPDCQRDLILHSFEAMLVNGTDTMALEQLAVRCAYLYSALQRKSGSVLDCHEASSSMSSLLTKGDIESITPSISSSVVTRMVGLFLHDLPWKLGSICSNLDISGLVANRCLRVLLQHVSSPATGASNDDLPSKYDLFDTALNTLKDIATCCSDMESNGAQYTKFIVSELATNKLIAKE